MGNISNKEYCVSERKQLKREPYSKPIGGGIFKLRIKFDYSDILFFLRQE